MSFVPMFPVYVNFTLHVNSQRPCLLVAKNKELSVSAVSVGGSYFVTDHSVLLEDPGVYGVQETFCGTFSQNAAFCC